MDWSEGDGCHSHGHMGDSCHGHGGGHSHSHGHGGPGFGGFMPGGFHGQLVPGPFDPTQQPRKVSHPEDSSSWDIIKATQFGALERCKELIEAGYDVRQPDKENVTLLHWAAINNRADIVKYYISKGAVIDQLGGDLNSTPLHWAIRQGHLSMVIQLMRYGADPSLADSEGYRGLHLALLFQHMPIAAYLMAKGQEVDSPDINGQTPLMLAAQKIIGLNQQNKKVVFLHSCKTGSKAGHTPIDLAHQVHSPLLIHMLSVVKTERMKANSTCLKLLNRYKGHTPIDLAHQVHSPLLIHMLSVVKTERMKANSTCLKLLNRYKVFLLCVFSVVVVGAIGSILDMKTESWLLKGVLLVCVIAVINLTSRCRLRPHIVNILQRFLIIKLFQNLVLQMRKPMRANHCFSCNACVAKQDHHSIWINGCIGARNHPYFVLFLVALSFLCMWMFYGSIMYWSKHCPLHYTEEGLWGAVTSLTSCSPWVLYIFCFAFLNASWAFILLLVQLYQIAFLGLTTAERANLMQRQRKLPQAFSLRQNPFNLGVVRNLVNFFQWRCCGLCKPMVLDWTQQYPMGLSRDHPMFSGPDAV
ncbi:palmitoyltransferase ZDHHC13-like [Sinocyclocheilus grahami]|uniref:palmitoyltransferase ZDHHC13-like n=1 Tax=Sinocyclocheilus grahami TaxID=75366 RepID=UPI0007AD10E9|nr:PREDICTED: palmitoyltransferase ZDHHC13-like [Sinocyclocheilus grahami]